MKEKRERESKEEGLNGERLSRESSKNRAMEDEEREKQIRMKENGETVLESEGREGIKWKRK